MTELLDLNDDCLDRIFDFCDVETIVALSEVCVRFEKIVTQWQFPKQTQFKCLIRSYECEEHASKIIRSIGIHLMELSIIQTSEIFLFYRCITSFVGANIRKLSITSPHLSEMSFEALAPILSRIEELELRIANTDMDDDDINVRSRCPNLRRLHILWDTSFEQNARSWPRLENLSLGDNAYITEETFIEFMQNNRQLTRLKFGALECEIKLRNIAENLLNLGELIVFQNYSDLSPESLIELRQLTNLQRIALRNVSHRHFNQILQSLPKLNALIDVRIQAEFDQFSDDDLFKPSADSIISLATLMPRLQVFGISFSAIQSQTLIDFLQLAQNLREIHVHDSDIDFTPVLFQRIVDTRKSIRNRSDPLKIFVDYIDEDDIELNRVI